LVRVLRVSRMSADMDGMEHFLVNLTHNCSKCHQHH
jgi:hypothetical protein